MTPSEFAAKWKGSTRTERAASQEHFIDLCQMLGFETPNAADPDGVWYAFEKGATKTSGGNGFADVWKRGHFAWEYKGKRKNLKAAYKQLLDYREALENPPLLVVCDLNRFEVHTNFTGTPKQIHAFDLDDLAAAPEEPLKILRAVMGDPTLLRPQVTREQLTEEAAQAFATLATRLRDRGNEPQRVAHFLNKLLFVMFAEDAGVLPSGILERLIEGTRRNAEAFTQGLASLFGMMADEGGLFGVEQIEWFNGGLFDDADVIPLDLDEIKTVQKASELDWSEVEPAIFGTLFERGLDPDKRSQLGAHYTDRASIERLVEPVLMAPLKHEFAELRVQVEALLASGKKFTKRTPLHRHPGKLYRAFMDRLRSVRVLDPACGSGNFLYIALQALKNLEKEVTVWASRAFHESLEFPMIGPEAVKGIEINVYAAELARVTIWIGEIQWMISNGYSWRRDPILRPLGNIECRDALLDFTDPENPREAEWPEAEFIIGNPPFVGAKLLRRRLGSDYVEVLFGTFGDRIPGMSDLVCYWHEKARAMIAAKRAGRVGLLATQGIRGGRSRRVLDRVKESGDIFLGWSDEKWVLDGASVHISFVGFDDGSDQSRTLDGVEVPHINANLTTGPDLTQARKLAANAGIAFIGDVKGGPFDISDEQAQAMLALPNPDGRDNRSVVRPWVNALDITRRPRRMWIVDFGVSMSAEDAALFEAPFEYVRETVKPAREAGRPTRSEWWLHMRPCPGMRTSVRNLDRFIVTPEVSKHRIFDWEGGDTLPDHQLIVIARDDDFTFGVLHSRVHELWARAKGTQLREMESGFRYTPSTTLETFPFPDPSDVQRNEIAAAAADIDRLRTGWLDPAGADEALLKTRTLTNLYNEGPTWLGNCHSTLDAAVTDAYGWPATIADAEILERLLALNLARSEAEA